MTTSSKGTHSTSGMVRRAHFPRTLEGIVIDAQDRFHGRRPRPGKPVPSLVQLVPSRIFGPSLDYDPRRLVLVDYARPGPWDVAQDHDSLAFRRTSPRFERSLSLFRKIHGTFENVLCDLY